MTTATLHDSVAAHRFVDGLTPAHIDVLVGMARFGEYPAGTWVALRGDAADTFHLVLEGRFAIEVAAAGRDPLVVATVHPGEVLGWSWMLAPHVWHFDVLTLDHTRTIAIDGAALRAACRSDHDLGYEVSHRLARVIASRLEGTRLQLMDVYGQPR
ncbi:MAG: cyclic nucleotide-binding domain-containing protein [Ilumatobacteraceae bacterium]